MPKLLINFLLAIILILPFTHQALAGISNNYTKADVYYNEACGGCNIYLKEKLIPFLEEQGITVVMHDYVNDISARRDMNKRQEALGIPFQYQSHIMTFIDNGELVMGGHLPLPRVAELLRAKELPSGLVVYQDKMLEMGIDPSGVKYTVWQKDLGASEYDLNEPLDTYLNEWKEGELKQQGLVGKKNILALVITTGLLDGVNPCAIAVLIFFIAFLFTLKSSIGKIVKYGLIYIFVIYLTYLGIGFGLFKAIIISDSPHLMAKIGAWLVIALGIIQILGYFLPRFPVKLQIPKFSQGMLKSWLTKATLPAVIVGAFLVGLCTFPCSGGIYVAIIGLLAVNNTFWQGMSYLLLYNFMFVVPLIILLGLAGNKYILGKVAEWQSQEASRLKFWIGMTMIVLGVIILVWFV